MATQTVTQEQTTFKVTDASPITVPRGPVETTLTFFEPPADGSAPWNYVEEPPAGSPKFNFGSAVHPVTINDIRGNESSYDLNTHGFSALTSVPTSTTLSDFLSDDPKQVESTYYPEITSLLLSALPGSHRVVIFDHTIRRATPNAKRGPVNRAHVDQTPDAARERVRRHVPEEAEELLKGRVRLVNVWRPLNEGPVVASPLAYADSRSVGPEDVVPVEHRYPDRTGYTAGVKYTEQGKWYYWSGMTNDERILLQCYDSQDGARTPHSAFVDPRTQEGWPGRESIEVRTLVFG